MTTTRRPEGKPVGPFATFADCVARMGREPSIDDPEAFCGWLEQQSGLLSPDRKGLKLDLVSDADKSGHFVTRFATLNVIDHDGDVTLPGAFPSGKVIPVSAFNHSSWGSELPVGRAVIQEKDNEALAIGQLFLDTPQGDTLYKTMKQAMDLIQWSYGYKVVESGEGPHEGERVRFLQKLDVFEVSPVLRGAGINTGTLSMKGFVDAWRTLLKAQAPDETAIVHQLWLQYQRTLSQLAA